MSRGVRIGRLSTSGSAESQNDLLETGLELTFKFSSMEHVKKVNFSTTIATTTVKIDKCRFIPI